MELRVFDKTVQPLGAIDELASLLWHTKYFDVGTFSLLAPITDNNSRLLVEGNLIAKHDGKKEVKTADGGVWRRAAQITYVHITKDENGLQSSLRTFSTPTAQPCWTSSAHISRTWKSTLQRLRAYMTAT